MRPVFPVFDITYFLPALLASALMIKTIPHLTSDMGSMSVFAWNVLTTNEAA